MKYVILFFCLHMAGFGSVQCLGQTEATTASTAEKAAEAQPPTREAFAAEVERIRQQVTQLKTRLDELQQAREQGRRDLQQIRDALRAHDTETGAAEQAFREAWEKVRQLRSQRAQERDVAQAVADAKQIETQLLSRREANAKKRAGLETELQATESKYDDIDKAWTDTRQAWYDAQSEARDAASALSSFGRAGWYESYAQKIAQREALREAKVRREREQVKLREQWAKMTPQERAAESGRLEAEVARLDAKRADLLKAREAALVQLRKIADRRDSVGDQLRAASEESRALMQKYFEVRRSGAAQAEIDKAKQAADAADAARKRKQEELNKQMNAIGAEMDSQSKTITDLSQAITDAGEEWSAARSLFFESKSATRSTDQAKEGQQRDGDRDAQREAWAKAAGQKVRWEENPYSKQAVRMQGGISNGKTLFRLTHDCESYHSQMIVSDQGKHLNVLDAKGQIVFDGPVNTVEQRARMTQDVYYLWEFMNTKVMINGR